MRKLKPHPWGERFNFFPCPYFTLCLNDRQFQRVLAHLKYTKGDVAFMKNATSHATTHTFTREGKLTCVVTMDTKGRSIGSIAALMAHEAMHILDEIWDDAGEKHPSSELKAYAIQHLVSELMYLYRKLKR